RTGPVCEGVSRIAAAAAGRRGGRAFGDRRRGGPPGGGALCPTRGSPEADSLRISGTPRRQTRPSARQSNIACPPSWDSTLAIRLRVPKPREVGSRTSGPPLSSQVSASVSPVTVQSIDNCPESDDSAPDLAELVTTSCKASA